MLYYEVWIADGRYHGEAALTYASDMELGIGSVVSVPLRGRTVSGFVAKAAAKPSFETKPIKSQLSTVALPAHVLPFAAWLQQYYAAKLGDCLRQFAPSKPIVRRSKKLVDLPPKVPEELKSSLIKPLTSDQRQALAKIAKSASTTILLHGETGSGKTRVYLELAQQVLADDQSVIILTPEIGLTTQLAEVVKKQLKWPVQILHSELSDAERKRVWLAILEATEPVVVIGPRSALFAPIQNLGLVVVDEAHEPAYKQEQSPRYHAVRAASHLGALAKAKVVLATATPNLVDYHLADQHKGVVRMTELAIKSAHKPPKISLVDMKDRANLSGNPYLSKELIAAITATLSSRQQAMIYLNRRGSARAILCTNCGWQLLCPNCDIPLVYHADKHQAVCHTCGYETSPPTACPNCGNPDIVYKSAGTKALAAEIARLFPQAKVARFDSDNEPQERLNQLYPKLHSGEIDILVGTQLLAKGLDLPKLGLVGVIAAEASLALPDFTAEERTFQLLYQVIGRVGRGHGAGQVVIQSYEPTSAVVQAAAKRDWAAFYKYALRERQQFGFPPACYLMQLRVRRSTAEGAENAALKLKDKLRASGLKVEVIGPTPSFYARRGSSHYWQLVAKAKRRSTLLELAKDVPADWTIDLDPVDLL